VRTACARMTVRAHVIMRISQECNQLPCTNGGVICARQQERYRDRTDVDHEDHLKDNADEKSQYLPRGASWREGGERYG